MKITAVVPIRKGSQRVKDKNLRTFSNTCLLRIKLQTLLNVSELDSIIVNTNSEEAINLVVNEFNGTKVSYHKREEYYASSNCSGSEFFRHLGEVTDTDVFVYTPCTSPFVKAETYSRCINKFLKTNDFDCLATVSSVKEFLWLDGKALNYNPLCAPNSQNLPNILALNFGVSVISKVNLIKHSNIIGDRPQFVTTDDIESIDIDTPLDFYIAEQIYTKIVLDGRELLD